MWNGSWQTFTPPHVLFQSIFFISPYLSHRLALSHRTLCVALWENHCPFQALYPPLFFLATKIVSCLVNFSPIGMPCWVDMMKLLPSTSLCFVTAMLSCHTRILAISVRFWVLPSSAKPLVRRKKIDWLRRGAILCLPLGQALVL